MGRRGGGRGKWEREVEGGRREERKERWREGEGRKERRGRKKRGEGEEGRGGEGRGRDRRGKGRGGERRGGEGRGEGGGEGRGREKGEGRGWEGSANLLGKLRGWLREMEEHIVKDKQKPAHHQRRQFDSIPEGERRESSNLAYHM